MDPHESDQLVAQTTQIARRALDGDSLAISRKFNPALLALARRRLGPRLARHCSPEDLVADTWLIALPALCEFDPHQGRVTPRLMGFLSKTLMLRPNNLLHRHCVGKPGRVEDDWTLKRLAGNLRGPVTEALIHEEVEELHRALEKLDSRDQEIVRLRGLQQLAHADIAPLLGISVQNSKTRYSRALRTLAGLLPGSVFRELLENETEATAG